MDYTGKLFLVSPTQMLQCFKILKYNIRCLLVASIIFWILQNAIISIFQQNLIGIYRPICKSLLGSLVVIWSSFMLNTVTHSILPLELTLQFNKSCVYDHVRYLNIFKFRILKTILHWIQWNNEWSNFECPMWLYSDVWDYFSLFKLFHVPLHHRMRVYSFCHNVCNASKHYSGTSQYKFLILQKF